MFDLTKRFSIGINIDDPWIYAGTIAPKSIIIPHLLSIRLPVGKALGKIDELAFQKHKHVLQKNLLAWIVEKPSYRWSRIWYQQRYNLFDVGFHGNYLSLISPVRTN